MAKPSKEATYSVDNIVAVGPGLINGKTGELCHFNVYTGYIPKNENDFDPRTAIDFFIEGPSEPLPLKCVTQIDEAGVDVTYSPVLPGDYKINVKYKGNHIKGSPFQVKVTGESIRQHTMTSKVKVYGANIKYGTVNKENVVMIDIGDKAIAGGLKALMAGPKNAKVGLKMVLERDTIYKVTFKPDIKGSYQLFVKIADINIPNSPFKIEVK